MTDYLDRGGQEIKREFKTLEGDLVLYGREDGPLYLTLRTDGAATISLGRFEYWEHQRGHLFFERIVAFVGKENILAA